MKKSLGDLTEVLKKPDDVRFSGDYFTERCLQRPGRIFWFCADYGQDFCPKTCYYALEREK